MLNLIKPTMPKMINKNLLSYKEEALNVTKNNICVYG